VGVSEGSLSLHSSIVNIVNVFTGGWGTWFASCSTQNPVLCQNCPHYLIPRFARLLYLLPYLSPSSIPFIAQLLTTTHPTLLGNSKQHSFNLYSGSTPWQVRDRVCMQYQYSWEHLVGGSNGASINLRRRQSMEDKARDWG